MFKELETKPFDILMFRPVSITGYSVCIASFSTYSHAAIYLGNGWMIESHPLTGVVITQVPEDRYETIDVYRYKGVITKEQKEKMLEWANKQVGRKYDWIAYIPTFIYGVLGRVLDLVNLRKSCPGFLNRDLFYFCYELVTMCFQFIGILLCPKVHPKNTTGEDFKRSEELLLVS